MKKLVLMSILICLTTSLLGEDVNMHVNSSETTFNKPAKVKVFNVLKACATGVVTSVLGYYAIKHLMKTFDPFSGKKANKHTLPVRVLLVIGNSVPAIGLGYLTYINTLATFKYASQAIDTNVNVHVKSQQNKV